jgi:hypothetical protein
MPDTLLITSLRWTLDSLSLVLKDARAVEPKIDQEVSKPLDIAFDLLDYEPLKSAAGVVPSRTDVEALRSEGRPWNVVAPIADELRCLTESSLMDLSNRVIMPSEELLWRLFHLAVLGEILLALRRCGCLTKSIRPLSASTNGPSYHVLDPQGRRWDLWFEAAGAWSWYHRRSPYVRITEGIAANVRSLGADIAIILPETQALIFECKYSKDSGMVCRDGYEQAVTYAAEMRTELAAQAIAVVVGPEGVLPVRVAGEAFTDMVVGKVGIVPPSCLGSLIESLLSA